MAFQLTKKQQVKEILRCGKDPAYFLKTYARISHPMHGLILFDTYDFQDILLQDFNDYRFNSGNAQPIGNITHDTFNFFY